MKIDLQIHSTYSDGIETPKELVKRAYENGLKIISVTEHDNVSSFAEVEQACKEYGIHAISGVEISTTFHDKTLHILGYKIDTNNSDLKKFFRKNIDYRKQRISSQFEILNSNLRENGKDEAKVERYLLKEDKYFTIPGLSLFLFEEGITDSKSEGFNYIKGISKTVPLVEPKEAIKIIHQSGGIAVLSHPFAPKVSLKEISQDITIQENMIAELVNQGLEGVECFGTGHNQDDINFSLSLTEKYKLIITAGSDRHGKIEETGEGLKQYLPFYLDNLGDLQIPEEIIERIIKGLNIKI